MSVVAVKVFDDRIEIAADSILCNGWSKKTDNNFNKIEKVNDMIIGSVGGAQESSLLFNYAQTHKPASATSKDVLNFIVEFARWKNELVGNSCVNNSYIIVYDKKVFEIERMLVFEIHNYTAIGAGMDFSNAALYLGHSPKEAVKVSCELSCVVAEPIIEYIEYK